MWIQVLRQRQSSKIIFFLSLSHYITTCLNFYRIVGSLVTSFALQIIIYSLHFHQVTLGSIAFFTEQIVVLKWLAFPDILLILQQPTFVVEQLTVFLQAYTGSFLSNHYLLLSLKTCHHVLFHHYFISLFYFIELNKLSLQVNCYVSIISINNVITILWTGLLVLCFMSTGMLC